MHVSNLCSPVTTWSFGKKERKKLPVGSTLHYVTHILCWLFKKQLLFKFTHLSFFYSYFLSIIILEMTWFFYRLKLFFSICDPIHDPIRDPICDPIQILSTPRPFNDSHYIFCHVSPTCFKPEEAGYREPRKNKREELKDKVKASRWYLLWFPNIYTRPF